MSAPDARLGPAEDAAVDAEPTGPSVAQPGPERVGDVDHCNRDPDDRQAKELVATSQAQRYPAEGYAESY